MRAAVLLFALLVSTAFADRATLGRRQLAFMPRGFNLLDANPYLYFNFQDTNSMALVSGRPDVVSNQVPNSPHHLVAVTGARPAVVTWRGKPALYFNADAVMAVSGSPTGRLNSVYSIFVVQHDRHVGALGYPFAMSGSGDSRWYPAAKAVGATAWYIAQASNSYASIFGVTSTNAHIYAGSHFTNLVVAWVDGAVIGSRAITNIIDFSPDNFTVGGSPGAKTPSMIGYITQALHFSNEPPASVKDQIAGKLAWMNGLEGNLPTNHPYRNFPP